MKKLLLALAIAVLMATPAMAEETAAEKKVDFAEAKAKHLSHVEEHIAELQKKHECIKAAADEAALKECKKEHREFTKEKKEKWKEMKEKHKGEHKEMKEHKGVKERLKDAIEDAEIE